MIRQAYLGFVVAAATITGACKETPPPRPKPTAEQKYLTNVQASIRDRMKDPDSTKFRDVIVHLDARCALGEFMSKNGYGAYDGWQDFVWIDDDLVTEKRDSIQYIEVMEASLKCRSKIVQGVTGKRLSEAK